MRSICDAEGYARFPCPTAWGGRFSVLSAGRLFRRGDVRNQHRSTCSIGAAAMDTRCSDRFVAAKSRGDHRLPADRTGSRGKVIT